MKKQISPKKDAQMYAHERYLNRLFTDCFSLQSAQEFLKEHGTPAALASMYKSCMLGTFIRRQDPKWFVQNFIDHRYKNEGRVRNGR